MRRPDHDASDPASCADAAVTAPRRSLGAEGSELPRLEVLFDTDGLPAFDLPAELAAAYGGAFGLDEPRLYANFVETLDGVVAIPSVASSNKLIAAESASDRFVMGLLRACADALVIGAGTLAASPRSLWTPEQAFPAAASAFAALRRRLGRDSAPEIVVLSARGLVDPAHPSFEAGAFVLTTDAGAQRLAGRLPAAANVLSLGAGDQIDPTRAVAELHTRGNRLILCEGGPHTIGAFLEAGLVDELFLTLSPLLVGRPGGTDQRLALVEGIDLLPAGPPEARLLGVRRDASHLFLRYALGS
jgi:riboflavin biosynthesis pyrimidine reductase